MQVELRLEAQHEADQRIAPCCQLVYKANSSIGSDDRFYPTIPARPRRGPIERALRPGSCSPRSRRCGINDYDSGKQLSGHAERDAVICALSATN